MKLVMLACALFCASAALAQTAWLANGTQIPTWHITAWTCDTTVGPCLKTFQGGAGFSGQTTYLCSASANNQSWSAVTVENIDGTHILVQGPGDIVSGTCAGY